MCDELHGDKRMLQQINRKIHGYKSQDKEKELYNEIEFIQLNRYMVMNLHIWYSEQKR